MKLYSVLWLTFVTCVLQTLAAHYPCPPPGNSPFPVNCACAEDNSFGSIVNCTANETTNLNNMFDDLYNAVGDFTLDMLFLQFPEVDQPYSIDMDKLQIHTKFYMICIANVKHMINIDGDAIYSTFYERITRLQFLNVWFDDNYDPFQFVRKFVNLKHVSFDYGKVSRIPSMAFHGLQLLESITFTENRVTEIGITPFSGLPALTTVSLPYNQLTADGFSSGTFDGIGQYADVDLKGSQNLTYLPEDVFKILLDNTKATVIVGPELDNDEDNHLICDERADWICQNYFNYVQKLKGFYCVGDEYKDVFAYCSRPKIDTVMVESDWEDDDWDVNY